MSIGLRSRFRVPVGCLALTLVLALVFTACGSSTGGSNPPAGGSSGSASHSALDDVGGNGLLPGIYTSSAKPAVGGSTTFALEAESTGGWCLPEADLADSGIQVARAIYDYLTVPDSLGNYEPFLADKITPADNYTKWTIHLRSDIKFQDDSALNAQVVKDNLDAYRGTFPARKPLLFAFVFDDIESTKVVDPMTVEVDMKSPWAAFPASLYSYGRVGIMAEKQLHDGANCFKDMIGTGPFKLQSWQVNDHLTVVRNPEYWRKDSFGQRLPYLDSITFKPVPDPTQLLNGLKTKTYDVANTDDTTTAIPGLLPDVRSGAIHLAVAKAYPEVWYTIFNTSQDPFNNINARKAVAYAFDFPIYNKLRNSNLNGAANGPFGPGALGHLDDTGFPTYNLTLAKLAVAKYKQETGKGLSFTYSTTSDSASQASALVLGDMMAAAGMKMNIKQGEESQLINDVIAGSYQAAAWRNHPGFDPDTQWIWWHCAAKPGTVPPSGSSEPAPTDLGTATAPGPVGNNCDNFVNFSRFNDPVINKALETGRTSTNKAARAKAYETINQEFAKQVWEAWTYYSIWTVAYQTNVYGILGPNLPTATSPNPAGSPPFLGLSSGIDVSGLNLKP